MDESLQRPANYYDGAQAVAVDGSGNVFVTGSPIGRGSSDDYATIKYSGDGVALWTNRYHGNNRADFATAIVLDRSGNVFVTGYVDGVSSGNDWATIAYSGAGVPLWTNRYNGPGNLYDRAIALAVDSSGNVFVSGYSTGTNGYTDYTTIKYSAIPPSLTLTRTPSNTLALSWPSPSLGFTLQQNTNGIATVNWSNVDTMPTDNGTTKTVIVSPWPGNRFFRLKSQ